MRNKIVVALSCLCIALAISLGVTHCQLQEAKQQNARMEQQLKEMSSQINEIWVEYMGMMKRLQQHG